jgi:hypothetical protein
MRPGWRGKDLRPASKLNVTEGLIRDQALWPQRVRISTKERFQKAELVGSPPLFREAEIGGWSQGVIHVG